MQAKAKSFFLLMMGIFLMGVLLHLSIPLEFVVESTKKIQQAYNGYKISVQQNAVRALAILNSCILSNQIQIYQNIRSTTISLYGVGYKYDQIVTQYISLYHAYQLANMNQEEVPLCLNKSMWFIQGVDNLSQMNSLQRDIYEEYTQIEPYLQCMGFKNQIFDGLQAIQIYITYQDGGDTENVYFEYPSSVQQKFKNKSADVFGQYYFNTINNYNDHGKIQTIFQSNGSIRDCAPVISDGQPFGVFCLKLDTYVITSKITSILNMPDFQLSTSEYILVRPIDDFEGSQYPQIISSFQSNQLSTIDVPNQKYFKDFTINQSVYLFNTEINYLLNVQQRNVTKTYYVIPIQTYNDMDTQNISLYMIVVSNFEKSELNSQSRYQQFFVIMIAPSTILFFIAALSMVFLMKPIFAKLHHSVTIMNDYCHFIKRNDMNLQITQIGETSDTVQIFSSLKNLNLLNKLTTPSYLQVSCNERIMRLLRALQLFENFNYNKVNLYQNLATCYKNKGELNNAFKYLKLSVDCTMTQLGGLDGLEKKIKEESDKQLSKLQSRSQKKQVYKKECITIRNLRYKLYKLCLLQYEMYRSSDDKQFLQHMYRNTNLLRGLSSRSPPHIVQYCHCFILYSICSLQSGQTPLKDIEEKLEKSAEMITNIQTLKLGNKIMVPIEILISYWHYLKGKLFLRQANDLQAYQNFIIALNEQRFDPDIHKKIKEQIEKLMEKYKMDYLNIQSMFSYLTLNENPRQFILVSDTSNPRMRNSQVSQWKQNARKMATYIFDNYILPKDRIGINEFCIDLKVVCNLIEKETSANMLRKEVKASIKVRGKVIYSQLIPNLERAIAKTKNVKRQKVFLFFLKEGQEVDSFDILQEIEKADNSTFIFLVKQLSQRINQTCQGFYVVDFQNFADIDIILGEKRVKRADNIIHLL